MLHNERIKNLLDNIIADLSANREQYVKNPGVDFTRDRKLSFEKVIELILSMKGGSLENELYDFFGKDPKAIASSSAFIQQRDKLTDDLFIDLFHNFTNAMTDMKLYKGYRLLAVDGSDINIAYDKESDTYIKPQKTKSGAMTKGFNQYHLNAVYDLMNKVYAEATLTPKTQADERKAFVDILNSMKLQSRTIFIADRGYPSWNVFAHFKYKDNADYLIRVQNKGTNLVKDLPMTELDIDRELIISTKNRNKNRDGYLFLQVQKNKMKNREYTGGTSNVQWDFTEDEHLKFRIVRFPITETIFTSLPRHKFPASEIKKLYAMRWGIETSFRELKYVIGLTNLHSKKDAFVRQEIYAKLTMYNFCERIIAAAVVEQDSGHKHKYKINYTMGMKICLDFYRTLVKSCDVYELMLKFIEAERPGRSDERKLHPKGFVCFTYRVAA